MHKAIATARRAAGLTQAEVAKQIHISLRLYQGIEYGEQLTPDLVLRLSRILEAPGITMAYCRGNCPIGQVNCYEPLNCVDLSPIAILAKYRQEEKEASLAVDDLFNLLLNKTSSADCTQSELVEIKERAREMLDVEHVITLLKLRLWQFLNVAELMQEHHDKCLQRGYHDTRKPALIKAG